MQYPRDTTKVYRRRYNKQGQSRISEDARPVSTHYVPSRSNYRLCLRHVPRQAPLGTAQYCCTSTGGFALRTEGEGSEKLQARSDPFRPESAKLAPAEAQVPSATMAP